MYLSQYRVGCLFSVYLFQAREFDPQCYINFTSIIPGFGRSRQEEYKAILSKLKKRLERSI